MNTKFKFQTILLVLLLCLLAFSSTTSLASAQVGGDDNPELQDVQTTGGELMGTGLVPGGPGFIMVSAFNFRPLTLDDTWSMYGSGIINNGPASNLVAGLTLPHGATITKMTLYYRDVSGTLNLRIILRRGDGLAEGGELANIQTSGSEFAFRYQSVTSFTNPKVDNQLYSYYLVVSFPAAASSDIVLSQVRLDYDYPNYLPTVMK